MQPIDLAAILRRVEQIAANGQAAGLIDASNALSITLTRLDALADDLRKGLHDRDDGDCGGAGDGAAAKPETLGALIRREAAAQKPQIIEDWEPKHG